MLVILGIGLGTLISTWTVSAVAKTLTTLPRISELQLDWRSLVFAAALGALTIFLVGLVPAVQISRSSLAGSLSQEGRSETGGRHRLYHGLLFTQFAVTFALLASAGLLLRSYQRLTELNAGFNPDHVLTFHVGAEWGEDRTAIGKLQQRLLDTLQNTPGVSVGGLTNFLPTDGATLRYQYQVDGLSADNPDRAFTAGERTVSGGYLAALRVPMLAGANCPTAPMDMKQPPKALVNRSIR